METKLKANADYKTQLNDWIEQEKASIELIGVIGKVPQKTLRLSKEIIYLYRARQAIYG